MLNRKYIFKDISLLVTHYNRPSSLKRLLNSFTNLSCEFAEIVISDDGSKPENLEDITKLQSEFNFILKTTPINRGLGNNINKGQEAVKYPMTLYVQEDFVPTSFFPEKLKNSVDLMNMDPSLDMVRYYAYQKFPDLEPVGHGFSFMKFSSKNFLNTYKRFYMYSDHPHLRRSHFIEKFGKYPEGVNVEQAEYGMMMSFLKNKGKGLFYESYQDLFEQINSSEEPSTFERNWRRSENSTVIKIARHLYRHIKFNLDYFYK